MYECMSKNSVAAVTEVNIICHDPLSFVIILHTCLMRAGPIQHVDETY